MRRNSSEAYLISALIAAKDPLAAERLGITPEMFAGYAAEYRFLLAYSQTYRECPSPEVMVQRFPSFVYVPNEDVRFSADDVREEYNRRELAKIVRSTAEQLRQGDLDTALLEWGSYAPARSITTLRDNLADETFLTQLMISQDTIAPPWPSLERMTGGFGPGQFWTLAARLGIGKSWCGANFAVQAALAGRRVIIWSREMPEAQYITRIHSLLAPHLGVEAPFSELKARTYPRSAYKDLLGLIRDNVPGSIFILDSSHGVATPATVAAYAEEADLHIVDHIGLFRASSGSRAIADWRVQAEISNEFKEIAVSKKTRVLALAQINREGDTGGWKPPRTKNLSQSDAIGQDSDVVVTMKKYSDTVMTYLTDKNRDGPSDRVFWSRFDVENGDHREITRDQADKIKDSEDVDD
jgi:replicative DNA helicase